MVIRLGKWWTRAKYMALFIVLTIVLYELLHLLGGWIEPAGRYREPIGKALKAFSHDEASFAPASAAEQLLFFYKYGE